MCVCVVFVFRNNLHSVEAIKIVVGEKERARGAVKGFFQRRGQKSCKRERSVHSNWSAMDFYAVINIGLSRML